jgi:hypothetical protein
MLEATPGALVFLGNGTAPDGIAQRPHSALRLQRRGDRRWRCGPGGARPPAALHRRRVPRAVTRPSQGRPDRNRPGTAPPTSTSDPRRLPPRTRTGLRPCPANRGSSSSDSTGRGSLGSTRRGSSASSSPPPERSRAQRQLNAPLCFAPAACRGKSWSVEWVGSFNTTRLHSALNDLSPRQFEQQSDIPQRRRPRHCNPPNPVSQKPGELRASKAPAPTSKPTPKRPGTHLH